MSGINMVKWLLILYIGGMILMKEGENGKVLFLVCNLLLDVLECFNYFVELY